MSRERLDVVIIGAGLSGIGTAWHLEDKCPGTRFEILESRDAMGGTWDLFRYPGIRSDSDMFTLGYNFRPWREGKAIADGPAILDYIHDTARESGIDEKIRYQHELLAADWSTPEACWTLTVRDHANNRTLTIECGFLLICAGYYAYARGHTPEFPAQEQFTGQIIHPQHWPENLDYSGKRVVVIGSGATAVTLVPSMAPETEHITMLQRSPTYMIAMPDWDWIANVLRWILPAQIAYDLTRWKNIWRQWFIYRRTRKSPRRFREFLLRRARKALGPDCDFETHFVPSYEPWDQRLCLVPNADFFESVRAGRATVVTGQIERFTRTGILLQSGEELPADIIITATGLELQSLGGVSYSVDGRQVRFSETLSYKSVMFSDVPNLISTFGYINASWTLKSDLTAEYACRLLNHMRDIDALQCVPRLRAEDRNMPKHEWIRDFTSGYIRRGLPLLPRQGDQAPWMNTQNYLADRKTLLRDPVQDDVLEFSSASGRPAMVNPQGARVPAKTVANQRASSSTR